MGGVNSYSTTAASNTTLGGITLADTLVPSNLDNAYRALMADIRKALNDIGGKAVSSGTDTITLTTDSTVTSYFDGLCLAFIAGGANTGAATLNVDSVGAKKVLKGGGTALAANDIVAGMAVLVYYDESADSASGAWMLANPAATTLDATTLASVMFAASAKTTPVDADTLPITDSAASNGLKKITWANIKATLKSYFDTVYSAVGAYAPGGTDVAVADGGTGRSSHTAYAVLCGGTTTTAAQQSIAGVGTSGQVLTSNGAGALPTFQDAAAGGVTSPNVLAVAFNRMAGSYTSNSSSASDITGLSFDIGANQTWQLEVKGFYSVNGDNDDMRMQVTGPASPASVALSVVSHKSGDTGAVDENTATAFGSNMDLQDGTSSAGVFVLTGTIVNGANTGTIQVRGSMSTGAGTIQRTSISAWRTA